MPSLRREPIARSHRVAYTYVIMSRARETTRRPRAASPSSARLRLARSRSRTWTSARRTRRHPPSRIPRRTWSSCSCAGGGSSRRAATAHPPRWRRATGRRGRRGLRFGFSVFFFAPFREKHSFSEPTRGGKTNADGSGRRVGTAASTDRSFGFGRRAWKRDGRRRFFPESPRAGPRGVSGETRRGTRGGRRKTGRSRVWRRDAPATLARPPFVMVCCVSNRAFSLP